MTLKFFKNNEYNLNANAYGNHCRLDFRVKLGEDRKQNDCDIKKMLPWTLAFARVIEEKYLRTRRTFGELFYLGSGFSSLLSSSKSRLSSLSSLCKSRSDATRGAIKQCIRFVTCVCLMLTISTVTLADDTTTTETCANGGGTVITGVVSGHKYCRSNVSMNWWNAHAWCDSLGKRLFNLDDCGCNGTVSCIGKCPELLLNDDKRIWTANPNGDGTAYHVGLLSAGVNAYPRSDGYYVVCF